MKVYQFPNKPVPTRVVQVSCSCDLIVLYGLEMYEVSVFEQTTEHENEIPVASFRRFSEAAAKAEAVKYINAKYSELTR